MVRIDIGAYWKTLEKLEELEKVMQAEQTVQQQAVLDIATGWSGLAARTYVKMYSGMLDKGLYYKTLEQVSAMRKVMEDAMTPLRKYKSICDTLVNCLTGGYPETTGSTTGELMVDTSEVAKIDTESDNVINRNALIKNEIMEIMSDCRGLVDFGDCPDELSDACTKVGWMGVTQDEIDAYARGVTDLDQALVTEYKACYPRDVLEQAKETVVDDTALKQEDSTTTAITQKMLDNLKNDTSLALSSDKKIAMLEAAERLLNENYEVEFVAGVLGNIQNEGTPGKFESSNYKTNDEPAYLIYMDEHYDYRNKFSGKSIQDVGISAAIDLAYAAKDSDYDGKFGLGMIQWTGERTILLLESYRKYAASDKPTQEECINAEVNFMIDELQSDKYSYIYDEWKEGDRTASSAGKIICYKYEAPKNVDNAASIRALNADEIYKIMMK